MDVRAALVYDVGGKQGPVKGRTKSWEVSEYRILDLPNWDLEKLWPSITLADIIFCLEVFEYLIDPRMAINNIESILKKGGKAYISIPLVYPVHNEIELDSLRYTENGFKRLCKTAGLKAEVVKYRRTINSGLEAYYASDGMHPAKGIDHNITGYIFEVKK